MRKNLKRAIFREKKIDPINYKLEKMERQFLEYKNEKCTFSSLG